MLLTYTRPSSDAGMDEFDQVTPGQAREIKKEDNLKGSNLASTDSTGYQKFQRNLESSISMRDAEAAVRRSRESPSAESTATEGSAESLSDSEDEVESSKRCSQCSFNCCALGPMQCSRLCAWLLGTAQDADVDDDASADANGSNTGTGTSLIPRFLVDVLNGMSQVCFVTNSVSGAIFVLAVLIGMPRAAIILSVLGCASATGVAACLGLDKQAQREGLLGYNGVLVGCSFAVYIQNFLLSIPMTFGCAGISALVAAGLSKVMKPQLTLAFNVVALMAMLCLRIWSGQGHDAKHIFTWSSDFVVLDGLDCATATLNGIAQMFFVTSPFSGLLILSGILIASPFSALTSLLGSFIGALLGAFCGASPTEIRDGWFGYNGALIALWISLHFQPLGYSLVALLAFCGSTAATAVYVGLRLVVAASNGYFPATLTLPLCFVAFFLAAFEHVVTTSKPASSQTRDNCADVSVEP